MRSGEGWLLARVGLRLRWLRERKGLTQEQVAARAGFTGKYLSECERGKRDLPLTTLRAIVEEGLGEDLASAFGLAREQEGSPLPPAEPRRFLALAQELAGLPAAQRRVVTGILRAALVLAQAARHPGDQGGGRAKEPGTGEPREGTRTPPTRR